MGSRLLLLLALALAITVWPSRATGAEGCAVDADLAEFALVSSPRNPADLNANGFVCELTLSTGGTVTLIQVDDLPGGDPRVLFVGTCPDGFVQGFGAPPPIGADRNGDAQVCRKAVSGRVVEIDNNAQHPGP